MSQADIEPTDATQNEELLAERLHNANISDEDEANLAELDEEFEDGDDAISLDEDVAKEMDEMEQLHLSPVNSPAKGEVPSGAVPTEKSGRLSSHAAEFWFPECRNCSCCRGFKHGCDCVKKDHFIACQHESCIVEAAHRGQRLTEDTAPRAEREQNASSGRRAVSDSASGTCRFEQSPGGCRFGASCRFRHVGQADNANSYNKKSPGFQRASSGGSADYGQSGYTQGAGGRNYYGGGQPTGNAYGYAGAHNQGPGASFPPQPPHGQLPSPTHNYGAATSPHGGKDQICPYFQKGECMFGANCRNKHC